MTNYLNYDVIIFGILAGLACAAVASFVHRRAVARAVRAMLAAGATSPEGAMTADALGVSGKLLCGDLYGKIFVCSNEAECADKAKKPKSNPYKRAKLDISKARFYLPEEKRYEAEARFTDDRTNPLTLAVGLILLAAVFVALRFAAPKLIGILKNSFKR